MRRRGASVPGALLGVGLGAVTASAQPHEASVTLRATATIEPMYVLEIEETASGQVLARWESNDPDAIPPEFTLDAGSAREVLVRLERRGEWTLLPAESSDARLATRTSR